MYENGESVSEIGFSISQTDPSFNPSNFSIGIELQQELDLNIDHFNHTQFVQEMTHDLNQTYDDDQQNWENEVTYNNFTTQNPNPVDESNFNVMGHYHPSLLATSSFPYATQPHNPENFPLTGDQLLGPNVVYESRDFFNQSLGNSDPLIGGVDDRMGWEHEIGEGSKYRGKGVIKSKEKQRREQVNNKYQALKSLVPKSTKNDKASIIADAIDYIKELLRTKDELKNLVEMKRHERERTKRQKRARYAGDDVELNIEPEANGAHDGSSSLRSSWIKRKSNEREIDVRIVDDEVTIKLAERKKRNCLLDVSKVLDELQLDIHHVAGGLVGDHFSFLFNTKIYEGSCVYASAIANKIIEVMDKQYEAIQPASNF